MDRRKFLAIAGSTGVAGLAGCTYNVGKRRFNLTSSPVRIPEFLFEQTFIDDYSVSRKEIQETVSYNQEEREVTVETWRTTMVSESTEDPTQAWFYVQPNKSIGDRSLNPINFNDPEEIKDSLDSKWNDFVFENRVNSYKFDILSNSTELLEFTGAVHGVDMGVEDVRFFYANLRNEGDNIGFVAGIPNESQYQNDIFSLVQAADHPTSRDEQ